ncbi:hypothetical protein [Sphaerothrix gracilis]|uniref:hypothetical protein n=1 Tax=Sphaerothrix gracilis TaxID=3151835 RepID=UPI0031FDDDD5
MIRLKAENLEPVTNLPILLKVADHLAPKSYLLQPPIAPILKTPSPKAIAPSRSPIAAPHSGSTVVGI